MSKQVLYGLNNCDSCKKAMKALTEAGKSVTFVDIRSEADLAVKVPFWLNAVGSARLLNQRSTTWRSLSEIERSADPGTLLIQHPTLIKRPVIEVDGKVTVGWTKDVAASYA